MIEIIIRVLHTSLVKQKLPFVVSFVDPKRKEKAERFVKEQDRLLSFGAGYLLRKYLPEGEIEVTESGKPYLPNGPFFNISHSGEYIVLVMHSSREVGVDIEQINENKRDGIEFVLNQEEKKTTDVETLFQIWSNKESLIKCLSTGLKCIKTVNGLPLEGIRNIEGQDYFTKSLIYNGYSLSVTLKGKEPFDLKIEQIDILEE